VHHLGAPVLLGQAIAVRHEGAASRHVELGFPRMERDAQVVHEKVAAHRSWLPPTSVMGTPRVRRACSFATVPKCRRGITEPYSNQKSNRSPLMMSASPRSVPRRGSGETRLRPPADLAEMSVGDDHDTGGWQGTAPS